jgi:hypothetical protein
MYTIIVVTFVIVITIFIILIIMTLKKQVVIVEDHTNVITPFIPTTAPPQMSLLEQIQKIIDRRLTNLPWKILNLFFYNDEVVFLTIELDDSLLYFTLLPQKRILILEDYSVPPTSIEITKIMYMNYPLQL